jgi:hypothetical protein
LFSLSRVLYARPNVNASVPVATALAAVRNQYPTARLMSLQEWSEAVYDAVNKYADAAYKQGPRTTKPFANTPFLTPVRAHCRSGIGVIASLFFAAGAVGDSTVAWYDLEMASLVEGRVSDMVVWLWRCPATAAAVHDLSNQTPTLGASLAHAERHVLRAAEAEAEGDGIHGM